MSPRHQIEELPEEKWPLRLHQIPDPPQKLSIKGVLPDWNRRFLAVVGARKYSKYGKEVCETLIAGLFGYPVTIVSGLALGIDAIAHEAALAVGLPTLAVPGSGLHPSVLYPASNRGLADRIVGAGGCLISEFDLKVPGYPSNFPQRNRIMAGLSHAVLVIEAETKSGTLITSRLATDYNREVCTVPGSIFSKNSEGPHLLIRLGATPVTCSSDLLEALGFKVEQQNLFSPEEKYKDCSEVERKVIDILHEPLSRDEIIRTLGLPISEAASLLMIMEIKGLIKETVGEFHLL